MKVAFLIVFWLMVTVALVVAVDNLLFQGVAGIGIGLSCLVMTLFFIDEVKPFRLIQKRPKASQVKW